MSVVLGLDASTQSLSALLIDTETRQTLAEESVAFGRDLPHYGAPNGFVQGKQTGEILADPRMWLEALDVCLSRLQKAGAPLQHVQAISGAGQQHGSVYLNQTGLDRLENLHAELPGLAEAFAGAFSRPLSPIWMDTSTTAQCLEIEAALGGAAEVCRLSGSIATERFSGPQIRRFAQAEPQAYAETVRIHLVSSFMASVLAGREAPIDPGDGAGMNLMNLETQTWDAQLLDATAPELASKLPPILPSATVLGPVALYFAVRFGIPADAQVVAFTGDNPSSLVGMGATKPGTRVVSLGTSDTVFAASAAPTTDPDGCGHVFGNPLGGFFSLQCFVNGSLARERVRDAGGLDWEGFDRCLASTPPGNEGRWLIPLFNAEISPRLEALGAVPVGDFGGDWRGHPAAPRACVEAQFLNLRLRSRWISEKATALLLTGGASRNESLGHILADIFQLPVQRFRQTGSVALGAAIRAAHAVFKTDPETLAKAFLESGKEPEILPRTRFAEVYNAAAATIEAHLQQLKVPSQADGQPFAP
jgi:xylulokinase